MSDCDAEKSAEAETVERVGHLVKAAGATLKEKRRPIKVVARDGTVKKVIPHVEVIEGLLHHEGITGELQAGVRPKTILCAVCKCVVEVGRGTLPKTCRKHGGKDLCPRGCGRTKSKTARCCFLCKTDEEWSAAAKKAATPLAREKARARMMSMTPEERSERARQAGKKAVERLSAEEHSARWRGINARMTAEQKRERADAARLGQLSRTAEERSQSSLAAWGRMTAEQRSDIMRKAKANMTPEARSNAARKGRSTQLAKKAAEKAGEQ